MGVVGQPHAPAASTSGKDPVPFVQGAGWAPGPVWTGGKSRPHQKSIPDRPARSQSLHRLSYPAQQFYVEFKITHLHHWKALLFQYSTDTAVEGVCSDTAG